MGFGGVKGVADKIRNKLLLACCGDFYYSTI